MNTQLEYLQKINTDQVKPMVRVRENSIEWPQKTDVPSQSQSNDFLFKNAPLHDKKYVQIFNKEKQEK